MSAPPQCPTCGSHHHPHQAHTFRSYRDPRYTDASKSVEVTENGEVFKTLGAPDRPAKKVSEAQSGRAELLAEVARLKAENDRLNAEIAKLREPTALDYVRHVRQKLESNKFDKKAYQREYMRKKRQKT